MMVVKKHAQVDLNLRTQTTSLIVDKALKHDHIPEAFSDTNPTVLQSFRRII